MTSVFFFLIYHEPRVFFNCMKGDQMFQFFAFGRQELFCIISIFFIFFLDFLNHTVIVQ